jgi:hypothetical protein
VDVEHVFSQGRIVLSHLRSRLSVQSTRALMCLGVWSWLGYVKDIDIRAVVILPEASTDTKAAEIAVGWDAIVGWLLVLVTYYCLLTNFVRVMKPAKTRETLRTHTLTRQEPVPLARVWVVAR